MFLIILFSLIKYKHIIPDVLLSPQVMFQYVALQQLLS